MAVLLRQGRQPHQPRRQQNCLPGRHGVHVQRRERADRQERHHVGLVLRQTRQRNRRGRQHPPHGRVLDRLQPAGRHHRGRQDVRPGSRRHGQRRTHQARFDLVPPHGPRPGIDHDERRRHRIHPRTGGHAELHDDWGKSYYYLTDATGNVLGLADSTGKRTHTYAYGPTGLPRTTPTESVPQPYRYAGAYADPTGLYKMGHRYYDPTLGRFTQPDPSGQEKNPYLYASGDPINNTDPTGLYGIDDFAQDIGTIAAGAGSGSAVGAGIGCGVGFFVATLPGCGAGAAVGTAIGGAAGVIGTTITVIALRN
ncbi:RHS repeat-associated core domain-containing protein [Streptomyces sp. CA-100214]